MDAFFQVISVLLPALLRIVEGHLAALDSISQAPLRLEFIGTLPQLVTAHLSYLTWKTTRPQK